MNFWATQLGGTPAPAPAQQPSIAGYPNGYSPSPFYQPPAQQHQQPVQQHQQVPQQNDGEWGTIEGSLKKARSASLTETCPECGSGDFFKPQGNPNAMSQCYTCGYNPRFGHTTAGGGMPSGDTGPTQAARQTESGGRGGVSNYRPQQVIGKVGG